MYNCKIMHIYNITYQNKIMHKKYISKINCISIKSLLNFTPLDI